MLTRQPTSEGVRAAAASIAAILPPTPLLPVEIDAMRCWVKAESLQPIGAFKIRGGWWRLSNLSEEERARGVVAVSSGNHAQGVAWAARRLGIKAAIVMPRDAPKVKLEATRALGAEIVLYERPGEDREEVAAREVEKRGAVFVHAFADPWVIEGQGSAGIEIAGQLGKQPPLILACCGGGGGGSPQDLPSPARKRPLPRSSRWGGTWWHAALRQALRSVSARTRPQRSAMRCAPMRPDRS